MKPGDLKINERRALALWATTRLRAVEIARHCGMSTSKLSKLARDNGIGRPPKPKPKPRSGKRALPKTLRPDYYARSPKNERKRAERP